METQMWVYMTLTAVLVLIAAAATIFIGISKKNKEESPTYDSKTKEYWVRLTIIYTVSFVVSTVILFAIFG